MAGARGLRARDRLSAPAAGRASPRRTRPARAQGHSHLARPGSGIGLATAAAENGLAFVETDGRAHANPARMANIGLAAADLAARLASLCPVCGTPGYWQVDRVAGLPCAGCGAPTRETRASIHGCLTCAHRETRPLSGPSHADPGRCNVCNP